MDTLLQLHALHPRGLEPVDLELTGGECVALMGSSGSGKTLLLRAIADLDPAEGDAVLDGAPRSAIDGPSWRRRIAYLAAESGWWSERVRDHFGDWSAVADDAQALGLPPDCDQWRVERLSTGERQRLALLRTLANRPQILLLDEPTSSLDAQASTAVESLVRARRAAGAAVLWVTHDADQAVRVSTRRLALANGRLEAVA